MKCINCGEKTDENQIVCAKCKSVDRCRHFLMAHVCGSFRQMENAEKGACANFLLCEPIKKALKSEALIAPNIGHVICPHAGINLAKAVYGQFTEEILKTNYPECLE